MQSYQYFITFQMKTIEILERVRIISPIVEPLYTRNWMNCAGCLNEEQLASFFSECVKCGTLQIYQELYEKANGDLDTFFSEANKLPGVKSEIIKKGSA